MLKLFSTPVSSLLTAITVLMFVPSVTLASGTLITDCGNQASPGSRSYLPDCRAYEIVSPPYKEAMAVRSVGGLAPNGDRLIIQGFGSMAGVESMGTFGAVYSLDRESAGWQSSPLEAPLVSTYPRFEEVAASNDLAGSLWSPTYPDQATEDIYLNQEKGPFVSVGPAGPSGAIEPRLSFVGASNDLSHLAFIDRAPLSGTGEVRLWPGDHTEGEGQPSLYEYVGVGNTEPQLVGISNGGQVDQLSASHLVSRCGTELGSPEGDVYNAISRDGSTIFFTALGIDAGRACGELSAGVEPSVNELYARIDGGRPNAHTVAISEPVGSDCEECETSHPTDALFRGASSDGSKVFFTTKQHLLPEATGEGESLYEYDFGAPKGKKVALISTGDVAGARIQGVLRVSEDGSHIYFIAQGVLTTQDTNTFGAHPQEGTENLYVSVRECAGRESCAESRRQTSFVGRLSETDSEDWSGRDVRPVQATSDGRFLVFKSGANLTPDQEGQTGAAQIFEYDAQTGDLVRISRAVKGYGVDDRSSAYPASIPSPSYYEVDYPESRFVAISAEGAYVFFTSLERLSPVALAGHRNVYEYHAGSVALISDGHDLSASGSRLLGADETGHDVFFTSNDPLVPQDIDTQEDIYDARIDGGFPGPTPIRGCSEDACQQPMTSGLQLSTPSTSSSTGEGVISSSPIRLSTAKAPSRRTSAKKNHRRRHTRRSMRSIRKKR